MKTIVALLLLAPATVVAAQSTPASGCSIQGLVRDATGLPLVGVTVVATPGGPPALTDADGRYCLTGLATGDPVTLVASLDGFRPESRKVDVPTSGAAATTDLALQPAGFNDHIVVTATRTSRRLSDVAVRTEIVEVRDRQACVTLTGEIQARIPDLEITGPPEYLRSNFIHGYKSIPVKYTPSNA